MSAADNSTFKPISNPYIVGNPIEDKKMFFGREDDFEYIRKKVTGGREGGLLVLCGTRRSGKTSILFQIKRGRLGEDFLPVLIDMQSMTVQDDAEFLAKLAQEIIAALGSPDVSFERDYMDLAAENPFTAFQSLIKVMNTELKGRKLVLMFDEYELFETHIDKGRFSTDILNLLANWMEHRHGVFMIFTGSDKLEGRNKQYWGSFLGKALHRRISFLSRADTLRLVNDPLSGTVNYAEGVPEAIYELTAGQPFYTQVMCQSIVDHLNEAEIYDVGKDDIDTVVKEIIDNPLPQMIFTWSSLSPIEKMSLSSLAELSKGGVATIPLQDVMSYPAQEKLGYKFDQGRLKEAFERLFGHDLLDKDKDGQCFSFKMDLWRKWVLRMHSIWQVMDEIGGGEGAEIGDGVLKAGEGTSRARLLRFGIIGFVGLALAITAGFTIYRSFVTEEGQSMEILQVTPAEVDSTTLSVTTTPAGATVFLNDRRIETTPLVEYRVAAAAALLQIEMEGYRTFTDSLFLAADEPMEKNVDLEELRGEIAVTSSPAGAAVYLNGRDTGLRTPATLPDLSVNQRYNIELRLQGHASGRHSNVEVLPDSAVSIAWSFQANTYPLFVVVDPPGAEVRMDGSQSKPSPANFPGVREGSHTLLVRMHGYADKTVRVSIPAPNNRMDIALERLPDGVIEFQIIPYADIYINGELRGTEKTNLPLSLPEGTYQVRMVWAGQEWTTEVVVKSGERQVVRHDFTAGGN
jgi:hypothetical protein